MGPMATVDFLGKLTRATPAVHDQQHIPMVVRFCPDIPDRSDAIESIGPSPLPALVAAARQVEADGAGALVIPCNTAHAWYGEIAAGVRIPVLHIVDAAIAQIPPALREQPIGLLATRGTLRSAVYQNRQAGLRWVLPSEQSMSSHVMPAIRAVKANEYLTASAFLAGAIAALLSQGVGAIVLACTELPLAHAGQDYGVPLIDATDALARSAVQWAGSVQTTDTGYPGDGITSSNLHGNHLA